MKVVQPLRSQEDIDRVKNYLRRKSYRNYFLFTMGINSGFRVSDLLPLKVKDVRDRTHIVIQEKKTKKPKRFPINPVLREEIFQYTRNLDDEDYLFPSTRTGEPISRIQAYRFLKEAADALGMDEIGTHTMRKTFGYHYYNKTGDIILLMKIFNHAAPSVTMAYIGMTQDLIDQSLQDFSL